MPVPSTVTDARSLLLSAVLTTAFRPCTICVVIPLKFIPSSRSVASAEPHAYVTVWVPPPRDHRRSPRQRAGGLPGASAVRRRHGAARGGLYARDPCHHRPVLAANGVFVGFTVNTLHSGPRVLQAPRFYVVHTVLMLWFCGCLWKSHFRHAGSSCLV